MPVTETVFFNQLVNSVFDINKNSVSKGKAGFTVEEDPGQNSLIEDV